MEVKRSGSQPSRKGTAENFTGRPLIRLVNVSIV